MDDGNTLYAVLVQLAAWLNHPSTPLTPTASRAELVFGVPILAAWGLGLWMLADVQRDLDALRRSGRNGQLLVMKKAAVRRERLAVAGLTGWVIALAPLLADSRIRTVTFVAGALIYAWCKAANAIVERRYRIRQERYYERLAALAAATPPASARLAPLPESLPTKEPARD